MCIEVIYNTYTWLPFVLSSTALLVFHGGSEYSSTAKPVDVAALLPALIHREYLRLCL